MGRVKQVAGYFFGILILLAGISFIGFMATSGGRTGFGDVIVAAAFLGGGTLLILA
jgi:hypothetical protein